MLKRDFFQIEGADIYVKTSNRGFVNYRVKMSLDSNVENDPKMMCANYDEKFSYSNCLRDRYTKQVVKVNGQLLRNIYINFLR